MSTANQYTEEKANYIANTIMDYEGQKDDDLYTAFSDVICQFDTNVAIRVMEKLRQFDQVFKIKVYHGY